MTDEAFRRSFNMETILKKCGVTSSSKNTVQIFYLDPSGFFVFDSTVDFLPRK